MSGTYPNQVRDLANHLYHEWGGYYVLTQAVVDVFGQPRVGGGYYDIRALTYDEALTIKLQPGQGLRVVAPGRVA